MPSNICVLGQLGKPLLPPGYWLAHSFLKIMPLQRHFRRGASPSKSADKSLELTEVAYLLGFADVNSFFRAFQRREGSIHWRFFWTSDGTFDGQLGNDGHNEV
jgi:hypothetical protein